MGREVLAGGMPGLLECLAVVPDPRDRRGVRHRLVSLLAVTVAAVVAGARSFAAVAEWAADASPQVMAMLQVRWDPLRRRWEPPDEATIRRVLEQVDPQAFDAAAAAWLTGRFAETGGERAGRRRVVNVDGKSLRGTRHHTASGTAIHLLSVLDQAAQVTLRQVQVDGKSNEITALRPLLAPLDLDDVIVTADAQHTQRDTASFLIEDKHAHYVLIVKKNQPALHRQLKQLPWGQIDRADHTRDRGHGRAESRSLKTVTVEQGLLFPHAAQALRITRTRRNLKTGKKTTVTVFAITNLAAWQISPTDLAAAIRGHWSIEAHHHIRDTLYHEDHSQVRTGSGPQLMASLRNLAIATLRLRGATNLAAAIRHHARDATRVLTTLDLKNGH